MNAARIEKVTKSFGRKKALAELSFAIPQGSICGLIGPNGAGKTTAMGVLAGFVKPQSGTIDVLGAGPYSAESHCGRIGVMPQDSTPSPYAALQDSLAYYGRLQGLSSHDAKREAELRLAQVKLTDRARSRYHQLSHGMRRRFSIAQALLGAPELILLDEPTSGLDPELVVELRQLIVSLRGKCTVLVSSHILSELESMCDYAIFLENGVCTRQGPMREITGQQALVRIKVDSEPPLDELRAELSDFRFNFRSPWLEITPPAHTSPEQSNGKCLPLLLKAGVGVSEITQGQSLESAYMQARAERR